LAGRLLVDEAPAGVQAVKPVIVQAVIVGLIQLGGFLEESVELRMCHDGVPSLRAWVPPFGYSSGNLKAVHKAMEC
jgi:hypothetical protein